MLVFIGTLLSLTIFGFVVTSEGGGNVITGRNYKEYRLQDYSGWLRTRVEDHNNWRAIKTCILGSKTCSKISTWTPLDYLEKDMSQVHSGCCKPPISCDYTTSSLIPQNPDCFRWSNSPAFICYECDSCKDGVLEDVKNDWRKLSVLNIGVIVFFICIYLIGCCASRNSQRSETDYPYGRNRMSKARPTWDYYW